MNVRELRNEINKKFKREISLSEARKIRNAITDDEIKMRGIFAICVKYDPGRKKYEIAVAHNYSAYSEEHLYIEDILKRR